MPRRFVILLVVLSVALFVVALAAAYTGLVAVHMSNGFSLGDSINMPPRDLRMFITCPRELAHVWEFVDRNQLESIGLAAEQLLRGEVDYQRICEGGLLGF